MEEWDSAHDLTSKMRNIKIKHNLKLWFLKEIKRHEKMKHVDGEGKCCRGEGGEVCLFP